MTDPDFLYVVMADDTGDEASLPSVAAVFLRRDKAESAVERWSAVQSQIRYYIDTSFLNDLEDYD